MRRAASKLLYGRQQSRLYHVGIQFPSLHHGTGKPAVVYCMGVPGSGKTFAVKRCFPKAKIQLLDLDLVMKDHPEFNAESPSELYEKKAAYRWANNEIERELIERLSAPRSPNSLIVVDGTGTHLERQRRRMKLSRDAGFFNICMWVNVTFETAMERNMKRKRQVPVQVMRAYVEKMSHAVEEMQADALVDQFWTLDNNADDGKSGIERWRADYDEVWEENVRKSAFFQYYKPC